MSETRTPYQSSPAPQAEAAVTALLDDLLNLLADAADSGALPREGVALMGSINAGRVKLDVVAPGLRRRAHLDLFDA